MDVIVNKYERLLLYIYIKAILLIEIYIQYTIIQCISENTYTIMIITAEHENMYAKQ
jgi:hypothetical protein